MWVSGYYSTILFPAPVVTRGLPPDPALIRKGLAISPTEMTLIIEIRGSNPHLGESKVESEHAQFILYVFALLCVTHTGQVTAFRVTAVYLRFRPR